MKRIISCLLILAVAGVAMADSSRQEQRMDIETFLMMNRLHGPAFDGRAFFEGFEGGVMPPPNWVQDITYAPKTWSVSSSFSFGDPVEGSFCAFVPFDYSAYQNEAISFDHQINVAGGEYVLSFWMAGSRGAAWSENVAETVEVNGQEVWNFDQATNSNFVWEQFFIDLTEWADDGETVTITFRYHGIDGDLHALDAVMVDDGTGWSPPPPPPPPTNNLCEDAIDLQEQSLAMFEVDLCLADNNYNAAVPGPSCTGFSTNGRDVVYKIYLMAGEFFSATQQGSHDNAIWLVTDCDNPSLSCVAGADDNYTQGGAETLTYTAEADGWYYLIIDGWGTDVCSVTTVWIDAPVGTREASWSAVKSLYR